jgi:hypothetical protein
MPYQIVCVVCEVEMPGIALGCMTDSSADDGQPLDRTLLARTRYMIRQT